MESKIKDELVCVSEEMDCKYWSERLGVSAEKLKSAIRATRSAALSQIVGYLKQQEVKLILR
ncbi:DUF3606 domain-containing protein [Pedobacter sp. AW1-32]|uniref:DUF3606 domain-containing protein n=1 Tax=Pedobacter sp. AW1-32 TaxID=3383026 RepID=UPI003FF07E29